jgi:capsular polysaccharide biosynthesis protein
MPARDGCTFKPNFSDVPSVCKSVSLQQPEIYLTELRNVSVVGGSGVILAQDGEALLDMAFRPRPERLDLADYGAVDVLGRTYYRAPSMARAPRIEAGIMLQAQCGPNFYHWLIEHLSRLSLLDGVPNDWPLLVDRRVWQIPQLAEATEFYTGRPVRVLDVGVEYPVGRLAVPGPLAWLVPNLNQGIQVEPGDQLVASEAVKFLRGTPNIQQGTRLLYINRKPRTAPRRLANEDEVLSVFEEMGFEVIEPGSMTFAEQRALFAQAAVVAGESGSGLANMLFAPQSAVMLCLMPYEIDVSAFCDLTGHIGQRAVFIAGEVEVTGFLPYQSLYTVETVDLKRRLKSIMAAI